MQPVGIALRKRAQIAAANRTMFLWVAGASVIVGFAVVGAIFLTQMLIYNERVLSEKSITIDTLKENIAAIPKLKENTIKLDANQALIDSKAQPDDQAIQVILDALPSTANSEALGASLQSKLLSGVSGLTLNSLQVDSIKNTTGVNAVAVVPGLENSIGFSFSASGNEAALRQVLTNLEISIRTIDVTSIKIESQGDIRTLTVQARAFYEPEKIVDLKDKVVK